MGVELGVNFQAGPGSGAPDEMDHGFVSDERNPFPVEANKAEQAVFDFVPLAGAGGEWQTVMGIRSWSANRCPCSFQARKR